MRALAKSGLSETTAKLRHSSSVCQEYGFQSDMESLTSTTRMPPQDTPIPVQFWFAQSLLSSSTSKSYKTTTTDRGLERLEPPEGDNDKDNDSKPGFQKLLQGLMDNARIKNIPIIFMIHGGGFTMGHTYMSMLEKASELVQRTKRQIIVASMDYSLAPDFPFPTAALETLTVLSHICIFIVISMKWILYKHLDVINYVKIFKTIVAVIYFYDSMPYSSFPHTDDEVLRCSSILSVVVCQNLFVPCLSKQSFEKRHHDEF